jgi:hypothetical protein
LMRAGFSGAACPFTPLVLAAAVGTKETKGGSVPGPAGVGEE